MTDRTAHHTDVLTRSIELAWLRRNGPDGYSEPWWPGEFIEVTDAYGYDWEIVPRWHKDGMWSNWETDGCEQGWIWMDRMDRDIGFFVLGQHDQAPPIPDGLIDHIMAEASR